MGKGMIDSTKTELTTEERKNKLIFFTLAEAASNYYEGFYREEEDIAYNEMLKEANSESDKALKEKKIKALNSAYTQAKKVGRGLSKMMEKHIDMFLMNLSEKDREKFDANSAFVGDLISRTIDKNKNSEILALLELHESGVLDEIFKSVKSDEKTG